MKTRISKAKRDKIDTLIHAGFGAFAIVISMHKGYLTDHAIKIRDKTSDDIMKLLEN